MSRTSPRSSGTRTCALFVACEGALRACTVAIRCGAGMSSSCGWSRSSCTFTSACISRGCRLRCGCVRRTAISSTCCRACTSRTCNCGCGVSRGFGGGNWKACGSGSRTSVTASGCAASATASGASSRTRCGASLLAATCGGLGTDRVSIGASGLPVAGAGVDARVAGAGDAGADSAPALAIAPPPSAMLPRPMNSTCTACSSSGGACISAMKRRYISHSSMPTRTRCRRMSTAPTPMRRPRSSRAFGVHSCCSSRPNDCRRVNAFGARGIARSGRCAKTSTNAGASAPGACASTAGIASNQRCQPDGICPGVSGRLLKRVRR